MKTPKLRNHFLLLLATAFATLLCAAIARADGTRSAVSAGQKAPAFETTTIAGKTVRFPDDYKGKVVLLDFWATWCPPCREEVPYVRAFYNKYHARGFEILGVSLDKKDKLETLQKYMQKHQITWPQIYDGAYFKTPVAVKYGVRSIPCPVLVDGTTGVIIAEGENALSNDLSKLLPAALAKIKK